MNDSKIHNLVKQRPEIIQALGERLHEKISVEKFLSFSV
jgi:hypothetical protein